ncbi:MAG: Asparagine synthase [Thermoleophilaceae bacterium]|nr:Asparagine synthase [Thermoleophilaceae bacterium]
MSLDRCLFLARAGDAGEREPLARRIDALARWHGGAASWRRVGERVAAGVVRYDDRAESLDGPLAFGEEPALAHPIDATPLELRALDGATAVLELGADRACLAGGAGGPGTLFAASSGGIDAWSTHAVAAAYLATGRARVDPAAIPEQLAAEFVGGERSLIEGARPLSTAVRITAGDERAATEDYWPAAERWAAVPEAEAAEHAERHLLESLTRRAGERPYASLTAGLDSRVVAVALRELGIAPRAFTWGEADWDDVRGAADLARRLGIAHEVVGIEWLVDAEALREVQRQVRWNEGAIQVGFGRLAWPRGMPGFVTGAGGETGRAFYYRDLEPGTEHAGPEELAGALVRLLEPRLAGARREALDELARSVRGWVDAAGGAGRDGWRTLDVVYGEQRVRRWLRGMLPRLDAPMIPAFATPEIGRALASLPLGERLSDGFHRGFLARHAPDLAPAPAATAGPGRRGLRDRLPARLRPQPRSFLGERWHERPEFRDWIADGVLGSPLVTEPLGEGWAGRTRRRFMAGDGHAEAMALAAAGPVALADALAELNADG